MILKGIKEKRGISVMVGYVLLIVFAIIIGAIVFQWLRTYVPAQQLECENGVSVFLKNSSFDEATGELNVTIQNNGRFNIAGYFIHATNETGQELATIELSEYLNTDFGGSKFGGAVLFSSGQNSLKPGIVNAETFDIPPELGELVSLRITPTRFQELNDRNRFVSCGDSSIEQLIGGQGEGAPVGCTPDCSGRECGLDPVCGETCPQNNCGTDVCDLSGQCVPPEECTDTCSDYGYECGTWSVCGASTGCGTCNSGFECNATGQCDSLIGNGVCDSGETCAEEEACEGEQAVCSIGQICQSGSCDWQGGVYGEDEYCIDLGLGYIGGDCVANTGQCTSNPNGALEDDEPGAETYCPGQVLCCIS
ncbi:MAG TPA: hypothetical protein ENH99_01810 [Candidatus Pacearchaeota archaeon]|nr:hypothetical protein [Candidatus Pacearchaeota archaeon]